jgi:hypothetical protein
MNIKQFKEQLSVYCPTAIVKTDKNGQLVVYTNVTKDDEFLELLSNSDTVTGPDGEIQIQTNLTEGPDGEVEPLNSVKGKPVPSPFFFGGGSDEEDDYEEPYDDDDDYCEDEDDETKDCHSPPFASPHFSPTYSGGSKHYGHKKSNFKPSKSKKPNDFEQELKRAFRPVNDQLKYEFQIGDLRWNTDVKCWEIEVECPHSGKLWVQQRSGGWGETGIEYVLMNESGDDIGFAPEVTETVRDIIEVDFGEWTESMYEQFLNNDYEEPLCASG